MNRASTQTPSTPDLPAIQASRSFIVALALIMLVAALPYVQTVSHDFINYDDNQYITENLIVQRGLTLEGISWAFTTTTASNWHPLTWISHMIDAQIWGAWAGGHHLTNVLFHVVNSALVFIALIKLTGALWRSALVALIFAAHPLHVESVAWIAERKDVLSAFFGLLAIIAYIQFVKHRSIGRYAMVVGAFACSLMSKPMLVTLPFVLLLLDFWPLKRLGPRAGSVRAAVAEKVPLLMLAVASSVMTVLAQKWGGALHSLERLPLLDRIENACVAYGVYLLKTLWPSNLSVIYPLSKPSMTAVVASLLALIAVSTIAIVQWRKRPYLLTGWLWFVGTLVPVIGLVHVGSQAWADRYMYVPMIGLLIMVVWTLPDPARLRPHAAIVLNAVAAALIIACVSVAWIQVSHWKNSVTLFSHAVEVTDRNVIAMNILGDALRKAGRLEEAHERLRLAAELHPEYPAVHNNLGSLMMDQARYGEAQRRYEQSLRLNDRDASVWNNLGVALFEQGKIAEAETSYRKAIATDARFAQAYVNLGRALAAQSKFNEAVESYTTAIGIRPDLAEAYANLGAALWNQRMVPDAITNFERALSLNPALTDTRVNLGVALASEGRFDEAIAQFEHALRLDPDRADARQYLELARQQQNQTRTP